MSKDNINPDHYKSGTSLECIEAMELIFGSYGVYDFCKCNAWKYIWRWKNKNGIEDLKKAKWYVDYAMKRVSSGNIIDPEDKILYHMKEYIEVQIGIWRDQNLEKLETSSV